MSLIRTSRFMRDTDGNLWQEAGVNEFEQRMLECIEGPRKGEEMHDPRMDRPEIREEKSRDDGAGRYERDFYRDLYSRPFWEKD